MDKKISVIIPCYNVEAYIDKCVQSLVSQTIGLDCLELIFVDDASTDSTVDRLYEWEARYPETILVVVCGSNGRQGTARNIGMQYASGEYIGFVDSDDWVEPEMYEGLYQKAEQYRCDMVYCQACRNKANGMEVPGNIAAVDRFIEHKKSTVEGGEWPWDFFPGSICQKIFRRGIFTENHIMFPEGLLYEDNYFGMIAAMYFRSAYHMGNCFYHYRENPSSTTQQRNQFHHFDRLDVEILKLEKLQELGLFRRFHREIEGQFFELYYFNTLFLMATRFDVPPFPVFQRMKREILQWFPNYRDNPDLKNPDNPLWGVLLRLLDLDLDEEKFLGIMKKYAELPR